MLGYKKNYGLVFPALPVPPLLLLWLKDLALPRKSHHVFMEEDASLQDISGCS
jgi:hypothetical protein